NPAHLSKLPLLLLLRLFGPQRVFKSHVHLHGSRVKRSRGVRTGAHRPTQTGGGEHRYCLTHQVWSSREELPLEDETSHGGRRAENCLERG
uniref:Uncharacterized protein n=1 Tax=Cynoglossus semilaevis TaxID=244447 RepID=A0A3P8WQ61_CYNSE